MNTSGPWRTTRETSPQRDRPREPTNTLVLKRHACSAPLFTSEVQPRPLALPNWIKKRRVSSDHLPPTSTSNTTNLALVIFGPTNSVYVRPFRCRAAVTATSALSRGLTITVQRANHCGVHRELSTAEEWRSVYHHQPPRRWRIKITKQHVGRHSSSSFSANSCHDLQSPTAFSQHARPCARCTVMAKPSRWVATPAETLGEERDDAIGAKKKTWKCWCSIIVM